MALKNNPALEDKDNPITVQEWEFYEIAEAAQELLSKRSYFTATMMDKYLDHIDIEVIDTVLYTMGSSHIVEKKGDEVCRKAIINYGNENKKGDIICRKHDDTKVNDIAQTARRVSAYAEEHHGMEWPAVSKAGMYGHEAGRRKRAREAAAAKQNS